MRSAILFLFLSLTLSVFSLSGQSNGFSFDEKLYEGLEWRCIGPWRGGRSAAVTGVPEKPMLFYFGATGGGVWKTTDGGQRWENISDGFFGGSIGAISVSESDPNVIYAGGGEVTVRGNTSFGHGAWKSTDAGASWTQIGLKNSRHIPRIRIHPQNPDLVYAAVLGDLYESSPDRGVYRSKDGGESWEKILFANADAGAVDLILDPVNPRIVYASTWRVRRTPWDLSSGGEGSALWKSTDGGDNWMEISGNPGMPEGTLGIIGIAVSPVKAGRVWAIVEAAEGGVFRSENGGKSWQKVNDDRDLRQRAWYYSRIFADPQNEDQVYVINVSYHRSKDGGKTFEKFNAPHGDHHDLWISPDDPNRMIIGDDGGAQVSFDGGSSWSTYLNQPTAQFYRVTTDTHFPYRIYGAQQDNSTVRILHRSPNDRIDQRHWESSAGGESAHIAPDPSDPEIVFGGSYGGFLTRKDHRTGFERAVNVWPDNPLGYGAEGMKYRFQWNFPLFFSPHTSGKLYAGSNHLHASMDGGHSWEIISPDLTRNDPSKLVSSGGPITKDNTGVEYYCTIFAAAESPYEKDLLWVGSDDGLVHISRDAGKNWENVTPKEMPEWIMVNSIEPDPFVKGGAYIAASMYKSGDYRPYLYRTKNYGKSWTKITNGISPEHFTRVLRADPKRAGLLYCGTESGMYISFDDGQTWKPFQQNLPIVPITDLAIKQNNLIAATQGRSFWMIDDLTPLHQLSKEISGSVFHLFKPMDAIRMKGGQNKKLKDAGMNHPGGLMVHFYLAEEPDTTDHITLEILEEGDVLIRAFSNRPESKKDSLNVTKGLNRMVWDMRYADAKEVEGMIIWWGQLNGPKAIPGEYKLRLTVNGEEKRSDFRILPDPRVEMDMAGYQAQFAFLTLNRNMLSQAHETILEIREARHQLEDFGKRIEGDSLYQALADSAKSLIRSMTSVEEVLYQTKNRSPQDPLNYPIRLNNKLAHLGSLMEMGDYPPTESALAVQRILVEEIEKAVSNWDMIRGKDIPAFNREVEKAKVKAIILK
jgi:photosystem II stability/assembly factor-like uncharacterized protein